MAKTIRAISATPAAAAPPAMAAVLLELVLVVEADGVDVEPAEETEVVDAATVLEFVVLGAAVSTVDGTVKVEPPATATV